MGTKQTDSEATRQANAELHAIAKELRGIKRRLLATEKRLRAAESAAAVVGVGHDGYSYTVERWAADQLGDEVPELVDDLVGRLSDAADPDDIRAEILEYLERERKFDAKIAARRAAKN